MGAQEVTCRCCKKTILIPRRGDTKYCKNCKQHHKNLYAKWNMNEKREKRKLKRIYKRMEEENIDRKMIGEIKEIIDEKAKEEESKRIMESLPRRSSYLH